MQETNQALNVLDALRKAVTLKGEDHDLVNAALSLIRSRIEMLTTQSANLDARILELEGECRALRERINDRALGIETLNSEFIADRTN